MKEIQLSMGYVAWVDDDDYESLSGHKWHTILNRRCAYAVRNQPRPRAGGMIYMHREIMGSPDAQVDHRQHRTDRVVDNRKQNLRLAPGRSNQFNQRKQARETHSAFKGVTYCKRDKVWYAGIKKGGKRRHLGTFRIEVNAAYAYDLAAVEHFGEFALTNFPVPGSTQWIFGPEVMNG